MKKSGGKESVLGKETGFPCQLSIEGDIIRVVAELPGISEEMIRLDLDEQVLTISFDGKGPEGRKAVILPWEARLGKKRFRKGVLELTLEKPA